MCKSYSYEDAEQEGGGGGDTDGDSSEDDSQDFTVRVCRVRRHTARNLGSMEEGRRVKGASTKVKPEGQTFNGGPMVQLLCICRVMAPASGTASYLN